jgi:transposase
MKTAEAQIYRIVEDFPKDDLKKLYRKESNGRMRTRLLALYHLRNGMELGDVVDIVLSSEVSIRRWAWLYAEKGYNGLLEEDGRGRYKKLPTDKENDVKKEVLYLQQKRNGGRIVGKDVQTLLKTKYEVDYSLSSVYVLLDRLNLTWISSRSIHPKASVEVMETFKENFPDIAEKIKEKVENKKIEIWWQDEMRVGQQGSLTRIWAEKGTRPRVVKQKQFLSAYIFGACCPDKDKACALVLPTVNAEMMQLHILEISKCVEKGHHAIILLDRAGWHMTEQMQMPINISFVPLPPYSPELNPMEQLWEQLRKLKLSNVAYKNHKEIEDACCVAWKLFISEEGNVKRLCSREWAKIQS